MKRKFGDKRTFAVYQRSKTKYYVRSYGTDDLKREGEIIAVGSLSLCRSRVPKRGFKRANPKFGDERTLIEVWVAE